MQAAPMNKFRVLGYVLALILAATLITLYSSQRPPYTICGLAIAAVGVTLILITITNRHLRVARHLRLAVILNPAAVLVAFGLSIATRARPQLANVSLAAGLFAVALALLSFTFYIKHVRSQTHR